VKKGEFGKNTNQLGYAYFRQLDPSRIQIEIEIEKNNHHKLNYVIGSTKTKQKEFDQIVTLREDLSARCLCRTASRFAFVNAYGNKT